MNIVNTSWSHVKLCYVAKPDSQDVAEKKPKKTAKTLKVLDPKSAQNLCEYSNLLLDCTVSILLELLYLNVYPGFLKS